MKIQCKKNLFGRMVISNDQTKDRAIVKQVGFDLVMSFNDNTVIKIHDSNQAITEYRNHIYKKMGMSGDGSDLVIGTIGLITAIAGIASIFSSKKEQK